MSGSFTNQARKRMEENKKEKNSKDKLADKFNKTATVLIDTFLNEVNANNIRIDDTADLMRLYQIYTEVNDLQNMSGEGSGTLPELSQRQSKQMKSYVDTEEVAKPDGGYEDVIDPESLMNLGADDVEGMIKEREISMNEDNASEWEENLFG